MWPGIRFDAVTALVPATGENHVALAKQPHVKVLGYQNPRIMVRSHAVEFLAVPNVVTVSTSPQQNPWKRNEWFGSEGLWAHPAPSHQKTAKCETLSFCRSCAIFWHIVWNVFSWLFESPRSHRNSHRKVCQTVLVGHPCGSSRTLESAKHWQGMTNYANLALLLHFGIRSVWRPRAYLFWSR